MKKVWLMSICMVLVMTCAAAHAQDEGQQWNRHQGYYAELNAGTNLVYLGIMSGFGETSSAGIMGFGWNAAGGYNFNAAHALEVGFMQNYAQYDDEDDNETWTNTNIGYIAWRGTVPINQRFAFFGKLGAMLISIPDTDEDAWVVLPFTGLGVSYAITPRIDFSVQYQGAVYLIVGAGAFTGGITYHF